MKTFNVTCTRLTFAVNSGLQLLHMKCVSGTVRTVTCVLRIMWVMESDVCLNAAYALFNGSCTVSRNHMKSKCTHDCPYGLSVYGHTTGTWSTLKSRRLRKWCNGVYHLIVLKKLVKFRHFISGLCWFLLMRVTLKVLLNYFVLQYFVVFIFFGAVTLYSDLWVR